MARDLKQAEFDALLPKGVDLRPITAEQVRNFLKSKDYVGDLDTEIAKAEHLLRSVERKGYSIKRPKRGNRSAASPTPYYQMLKNWARQDSDDNPVPIGDRKFARGVLYYFFRDVGNHVYFTEIAKQIWPPQELIFQRLYYAKYHDDPMAPNFSDVCARFSAPSNTVRREFGTIWVDTPVAAPQKVHLGPVTIVLGHEDDLNQLSLQEPANQNYMTDGMLDIFKALDWRSRLSGFYGRDQDVAYLKAWALDETKSLKIMLVSGPGGAGKTRLVAHVIAQLVHDLGWCGGFLGDASRPLHGNGNGVALIIDYPEEKTSVVSGILKAASQTLKNGESYDRPVRIILVSRETRESWQKVINEQASFINEIRLDARPYLDIRDAIGVAGDIALEYPDRIDRAAFEFVGVEAWLERSVTHRLPLNIVAASVHAVLDPNHAFKLDGTEILAALAEWEMRRVRYYSERDLGDRNALEKLLALSLFTQFGLTKETIFELGEQGLCMGKSGDGLLEAIRRTPFWHPKAGQDLSRLLKLEPDRPAAAFCLKALSLEDPSPALSRWLVVVAGQDVAGFGERLSRLLFDVGYIRPEASQALESECETMLSLLPALTDRFQNAGYQWSHSLAFSAKFYVTLYKRLLTISTTKETYAALLNNLTTALSGLGSNGAALQAIIEAVSIRRQLAQTHPETFLPDLAASLNNQSIVLSKLGQRGAALAASEESVAIWCKLARVWPDPHLPDFAGSLNNHALRLAAIGRFEAAEEAAAEATEIYRQMAQAQPDIYLFQLATSLNNQAARLAQLERPEAALDAVEEAIAIRRELVQARPDVFLPVLATSLTNRAARLAELERPEAAVESVEEAISIHRQLVRAQHGDFLPSLASSLNTKGAMLAENAPETALQAIEEAVTIRRQLTHARPDFFEPDLASSVYNKAVALTYLGRLREALAASTEALSLLRPYFLGNPMAHRSMAIIVDLHVDLCKQTSAEPDLELVGPIVEVLGRMAN